MWVHYMREFKSVVVVSQKSFRTLHPAIGRRYLYSPAGMLCWTFQEWASFVTNESAWAGYWKGTVFYTYGRGNSSYRDECSNVGPVLPAAVAQWWKEQHPDLPWEALQPFLYDPDLSIDRFLDLVAMGAPWSKTG